MSRSRKAASAAPAAPPASAATTAKHRRQTLRELADELVLVFVIVMFVKLFLVELYTSTGSMTPTLIGGSVSFVDVNNDSVQDILFWEKSGNRPLPFVRHDDHYEGRPDLLIRPEDARRLEREGKIDRRYDRILVDKLAYWFDSPQRGDIVIFKVPPPLFRINPQAPIYVKRLAGLPGETLSFDGEGHLLVNDKAIQEPAFFQYQQYLPVVEQTRGFKRQPWIDYRQTGFSRWFIESIQVPEGEAFVMGDNTWASLDSRYWGGVPLENIKGRAFMRYLWPFKAFGFLK